MYYRVLVASQRFRGKESLTYSSGETLSIGQIVSVPLQRNIVLGIVENIADKPSFATKVIAGHWEVFIPGKSLELLSWLSKYYPGPLGVITELFTPPALPKKLPDTLNEQIAEQPGVKSPSLTSEQSKVLDLIQKKQPRSVLLHGNTGTGKTRLYVELAKEALRKGTSVVVLTPEIGLTRPLLETFKKALGSRVVVTHSDMTPAQRRTVWLKASTSETGLVVIGPRSALFSPLKKIGLIVLDEAHDGAYKQEQAPYYQASRVAGHLAHAHGALLVMGSATPLVSDYFTFIQKNLPVLRMVQPALEIREPTSVNVVDHKNKDLFSRSAWLANTLLDSIGEALKNGEQSLLFLNRRGSARLILCSNCGWQALCPHCDVALTYHHDTYQMRCHSCDFIDHVPTNCPTCNGSELVFRTIGTKALEIEIGRLFPGARVGRFDRDTEKTQRLSQQHDALQSGKIDIMIGTQSIAKGFDLPKLSVVGIVQADSGLQIPDYTANERTYQLISQVSGRIGRGHRAGRLYVQTYEPESLLITLALQKNYAGFYEQELEQRKLYNFPPFVYLLKITFSRASSKSALGACQQLANSLKKLGSGVEIDGPSPRFIEKIAGRYAWHLVVKSKRRQNLLKIIDSLPSNCTYDIDPSDLL